MLNRTTAIIVLIIAVLLLAGGLLFLCAASAQPGRFWLAAVLLVVGAGLAAWSGTSLRRQQEESPERVADRIVEVVRRRGDAEITEADVVGSLGVSQASAQAALGVLLNRQSALIERREDREVYVFPELRETRAVRKCAYCGSEFSVKTPLQKCPNCGGNLEIVNK